MAAKAILVTINQARSNDSYHVGDYHSALSNKPAIIIIMLLQSTSTSRAYGCTNKHVEQQNADTRASNNKVPDQTSCVE